MSADILKFPPPIVVHRSIRRVITIAGQQLYCTTEDWRTPAECERAMQSVLEFARSQENPNPNWDSLADLIMVALGVPADAPYGCSIVAEPLQDWAAQLSR